MTRVMIAASSAVVRAGLEALVGSHPGLELVGAFADAAAAEELRPDVVLAALALEDLPAPWNGNAPAIVLLNHESRAAFTLDAFRLGVRAVLPGDSLPAAILAAVDSAAGGLAVLDPRELEPLLTAAGAAQTAAEDVSLTPRELEVLGMMAEGAANKNIAWKLGISEHTVKFHVASILAKLRAGTRTEAVTMGIRRGLVLI